MEVGGFKDGYADPTLRNLAMKAKYWGVNEVRIEPNFGDGMFTKLITPVFTELHPCDVQEARSASGQKEKRIIDILEPTMRSHRLIVDPQVIVEDYEVYLKDPNYSFIYQLTRLSPEKNSLAHDDRVEAVAGAVLHWIEGMAMVAQQGVDDKLEESLEQWLDPDRGVFYIEELAPRPKKNGSIKDLMLNVLDSFWSR